MWRTISRRLGWLVWELSPNVNPPGTPIAQLRVTVHIRRWHPGFWLWYAGQLVTAWRRAA